MIKSKCAPIVFILTIILFSPAWVQADDQTGVAHRVAALETLVAEQAGYISTLQAKVAALEAIFDGVSRNGDTILFTGVNLQLVNGLGETDGVEDGIPSFPGVVNGLGNLIIGYNEERPEEEAVNDKTGSHNLVVGVGHNYSTFGGLVAGAENNISGPLSSVSGGHGNTASGLVSSVCGGDRNEASGGVSSVSGGSDNLASGVASSVSGGQFNEASTNASSVSGGESNEASGVASSVSGGQGNTASGVMSSVSGGLNRTAPNTNNWVGGGLSQSN